VATVLVAALALTGCGSSSGSSGSSGPTASFDVSSVTKDDAIAALLPAAIASRGTLVVGSDTTYAPAEYVASDGKTPLGYDIDLIKDISAVLGLQVQVKTAAFDDIIPGIGSTFDVGISSFTINADRLDLVNMISYYSAGEAYAVQKGNPRKVDPNNICGRTVAVQTGTTEEDELAVTSAQCISLGHDAITAISHPAQSDVTAALASGKADLMYADSPIVAYAVQQSGGKLEMLGDVFNTAPQGIVVSKNDAALTQAVQKALQSLMDDGTYLAILKAWGTDAGAITKAELNPRP